MFKKDGEISDILETNSENWLELVVVQMVFTMVQENFKKKSTGPNKIYFNESKMQTFSGQINK